ncbi:tandem-95 repeat protein, partial [Candidatus Bipolaricaulota bacterium]|nr:tandem-95 repeat protein [Candidatus Bipolaricaulota bacterium]
MFSRSDRARGDGVALALKRTLLITFALLVGLAVSTLADDVLVVDNHAFEYLGVTYNGDGTSTWTYRVTSGSKPSLSHWVLEFPPSLGEDNVVEASEDFEVNEDPTTGVYGLKFDEGYNDGETREVFFTLDAAHEVMNTRVAIKAGKNVEIGSSIPGPSGDEGAEGGNEPPEANDDEATTKQNKYIKISVLDNDSDPDGDNLTLDSFTQPDHGTVKKDGAKKVRYTPEKDFNGIDTFTYAISDGNGGTATATVTVIVGTLSQKPEANGDSAVTDEGVPVDIDILANDSDGDGTIDRTTVTITKNPGDGSVSVHPASGVVTYTPSAGVCGDDCFRYTVKDNAGVSSDEAKVDIEVLCNEAPEAGDDSAVTAENAPVDIDVVANDSDSDGSVDPTTVVITKAPKDGSANVNPATGAVTYVPKAGFCGADYFKYTISDNDGATSNEAKVDIEVLCNEAPEAEDDSATTDENTSVGIDVVANDSDSDGTIDPSTIVITKDPSEGTLSVHPSTGVITYTPDPGSCGDDYFKYTIDDNDGSTSNEAKVDIEVLCNDPPLAIDDLYTTNEGQTLTVSPAGVLSNDIDAPGSPLSAILIDGVEHGALTLDADGSFVYVHDGSETASDEFAYVANDANSDSNVATVSLVISPTNDQPTAANDSDSTKEDVSARIDVLKNDSDPDGDNLSVDWVTQPTNGSVVNNGDDVTYTPDPDFNGIDTFTYGISDGNGGIASATVAVTVTAENDPPIAQGDSSGTDEDVPVTIPVLANDSDPDHDGLDITAIKQPENGDVDNNGTDVTYTPDPGFNGTDTFTYTISDGHGGNATATVTVTVTAVNDEPTAVDDSDTTDEDLPVTIDVLANDGDPDGDNLIVQSVTQPAHGNVVNNGSDVTYTPNPGYSGPDAFTYTISDGHGGEDTATINVTIVPVNDEPVAQDDSDTTNEDVPVTIDVLANDSDPDGDSLIITSVGAAGSGNVANNGSNVTYTPNPGFNGSDTFTYTIADGKGGTDTATVT